jgi:uncharacterized protein YpbB
VSSTEFNTSKSTIDLTYELFKTGKCVNEIAKSRGLSVNTIQEHIVKLFQAKTLNDFKHFGVDDTIIKKVQDAKNELNELGNTNPGLRDIRDKCGINDYMKIKLALI